MDNQDSVMMKHLYNTETVLCISHFMGRLPSQADYIHFSWSKMSLGIRLACCTF